VHKLTNIKYGIKIWSKNLNLFDEISSLFNKDKIDYLEVYTVPGTFDKSIDKLKSIGVPIIIHAPHISHNFNLSIESLYESNIRIFEEVKKFAIELGGTKVVVHPGQGNMQQAFKCLNAIDYKNILVENLPKIGINDKECIGADVDQITQFLDRGCGLCLDLAHAVKAAYTLGLDYKEFITDFVKLKPFSFHLSDGKVNNGFDEHLNLGVGDFDLSFIKKQILSIDDPIVIMETPKKDLNLQQDIKNIEYFKNL